MLIEVLIEGLLIGIAVSIPLGPIAVICVQRTVYKGRLNGFLSGLGAAFADTFFAMIAGLGLAFFVNFFEEKRLYLMLGGGILLIILGARLVFNSAVKEIKDNLPKYHLFSDFASVFLLTLSNPITILFFGAVFAGFGVVEKGNYVLTFVALAGIFIGAVLWWFSLTSIVSAFRKNFHISRLMLLNRIAGIFIILFGIYAILSLFIKHLPMI